MTEQDISRRGFLASSAIAGGVLAMVKPVSADAQGRLKAEPFPMTQVRLLPSFWLDMMELNRSFLYSLPNDRLAYNFRVTAGIPTTATPLGGWEAPDCELRGHYVGHYLSACALLHASTGDNDIRAKGDALVSILRECQRKDGYLGAYPTTFYDRLRRHEKVWAPFYTYHKIMAGMIDMHQHAGNQQALDIAMRMANWANEYSASFSADEWQKVLLVEQGGMNEAAFNLYAITGKTEYRDLGYRFEHKKIFEPLAAGEDKLSGNHANTNIPKAIGAVRGYEVTGDDRYLRIGRNFYQQVVEHHTYCTGGTSNGEMWTKPDGVASELGPDAQECCCVYNMMKLARQLFRVEPDAKYFDYYERVLFNVRRGTQDRNGMLMYYVPLKPGMYKTFGTPFDAFWCCTGTGSEEYAKLNDSIYFRDEDGVYVNLFIPSTLNWTERGLRLRQTTKFPEEATVTLKVETAPKQATAIRVRIPEWATSGVRAQINGVEQAVRAAPASYVTLERGWRDGDVIQLEMPLTTRVNVAPDDKQVQAAMYGPVVLAALQGTEGLSMRMIYAGGGPADTDRGMPMPEVAEQGVWFERTERTKDYSLRFRTRGSGPIHTLVPLAEIMDERYSVYLRNVS